MPGRWPSTQDPPWGVEPAYGGPEIGNPPIGLLTAFVDPSQPGESPGGIGAARSGALKYGGVPALGIASAGFARVVVAEVPQRTALGDVLLLMEIL